MSSPAALSDLEWLASVTEAVAACQDEPSLFDAAAELLRRALAAEASGFLLFDAAQGRLAPARSAGVVQEWLASRPADHGLPGEVVADGVARRSEAAAGSEICVPLRIGARVLGAFVARKPAAFSLRDERLASVVALQVAGALERLRSEAGLKESEERFRSLSAASLDAILVHEGGRIVDVNQALCDLGGYSRDELVGRDGFDVIAPEYREKAYRHLLSEGQEPYEVEALTRDGRRRAVEVQGRSFAYRGRLMRVVAVRDLTARNQAAALRDSLVRELEARTVEFDRFGYAIAHELKAPLVTVKGFAEHLERDAGEGRTDRISHDARRIREAVDRVQRLFDELVAFSRAGQPLGPPVAVAVEELVREALRLRGAQLEHAGSSIEIAPPLPVVFGDRARLVQVFCHVIEDATSLAPAKVRLEARPPQDGRAVLVVSRSGPGAGAHDFDRLLGVERRDGRGEACRAGLSFVKRVIETHGGRVWLDSGTGPDVRLGLALPLPPEEGRRGAPTEGASRSPE